MKTKKKAGRQRTQRENNHVGNFFGQAGSLENHYLKVSLAAFFLFILAFYFGVLLQGSNKNFNSTGRNIIQIYTAFNAQMDP